jgi:5-methylcytosine-specific restriction endonuclease McrA
MEQTLLLNATYEPLRVLSWKKALILFFQGKVEILEEHSREIRSISFSIRLPSVVRLLYHIRPHKNHRVVKFSRVNIFTRDKHSCQYCGKKCRSDELTFDHVIPIAKGGRKTWENIVTACIRCNHDKSGRTPEEAGMNLIKKPIRPKWSPSLTLTIGIKQTPETWRDYLYWNMELEL